MSNKEHSDHQMRESIWSVQKELHLFYESVFIYVVGWLMVLRSVAPSELTGQSRFWSVVRDSPGIIMIGVLVGMVFAYLVNVLSGLLRSTSEDG